MYVHVYIYMYVYVCMYVCMYVCICIVRDNRINYDTNKSKTNVNVLGGLTLVMLCL